MNQETPKTPFKICPSCGTRISQNATRCMVCGHNFSTPPTGGEKSVQAPRLPEVRLSLPIAIAIVVIILGLGAAIIYTVLQGTGRVVEPTPVPTSTNTPTVTLTPTETSTPTPTPTITPLPPISYTIREGDTCLLIALIYDVSVPAIADVNKLPPDCGILVPGTTILVPQPTPTPAPLATATPSELESTKDACGSIKYTVQENDTLLGIGLTYNISVEALKKANGLTSDNVYSGQIINIPLCERYPTPGPTPTPTLPPPYQSPYLLLPANGAVFSAISDTITLQWASVGALRPNESYAIMIEDLTLGGEEKMTDYVTDTKYIVPASLRPRDNQTHIFRWYVYVVRQVGTAKDGQPNWESGGDLSEWRVFGWAGTGTATTTP